MKRWQDNRIFDGVSDALLASLEPHLIEQRFEPGETLFEAGDAGDAAYLLLEGEVQITLVESGVELPIATVCEGDYLGEMAMLDEVTRSATATALGPVVTMTIPREVLMDYGAREDSRAVAQQAMVNLTHDFSRRARASNDTLLRSVRKELARAQEHTRLSLMLVLVVIVAWIYSGVVVELTSVPKLRRVTSLAISLGAVIGSGWYVWTSPYSLSAFGIKREGFWKGLKYCIPWTLGFLGFIALVKWLLITLVPSFQEYSLFHIRLLDADNPFLKAILVALIYLPVSTLQEFTCRAFLQTSFNRLLQGKYAGFWAVCLSNALYSMVHMHYSVGVALGSFLIGLFFGFLWNRHPNLWVLGISHFLVGFWSIEIMGYLPLLGMKI